MKASNFDVELAERRVEEERQTMIDRARKGLADAGGDVCIDCGNKIPPARRQAMPSAKRCLGCQTRKERG